jgi:class 3 adenylate cyclase
MRAALVTHDEVPHTVIETHDGYVFKDTGDGVCAAFASPRFAVDAAVAAQQSLELPVRMGWFTRQAAPAAPAVAPGPATRYKLACMSVAAARALAPTASVVD